MSDSFFGVLVEDVYCGVFGVSRVGTTAVEARRDGPGEGAGAKVGALIFDALRGAVRGVESAACPGRVFAPASNGVGSGSRVAGNCAGDCGADTDCGTPASGACGA